MTKSSMPFDSTAAYEGDWQLIMRAIMPACVIRTNRSAIDLNLLEVYGDSSGMQVKVKSGKAFVEGFYFQSTAEEILAIGTADPTNPRIDRVTLKLDRTANSITLVVKAGTPGGSPVPPTLTETDTLWEMSLAQVYVAALASTITAGNVTSERVFSGYRVQQNLYTYGYKTLGLTHTESDISLAVADGTSAIPVSSTLSGWNIIDVICTVNTKGVTGATDVQLRRRRSGTNADVLSTKVTIGDEYYAKDGVVNTSNDDLATGDELYVDIDAVHTTPPKGLSVAIVCQLP